MNSYRRGSGGFTPPLYALRGAVFLSRHRAERGKDVHEQHVTFASWEAISSVMTKKRYELLRYLRHHPVPSVAALARDIGRDYKRVHEDVEALTGIGLIERSHGLRAPFDQIQTTISI